MNGFIMNCGTNHLMMMMMMMALFCLSKRTPLLTHFFLAHNSHKATNQVLEHFDRLVGSAKPPSPVHHRHRQWLIADGSSPDSATLVAAP